MHLSQPMVSFLIKLSLLTNFNCMSAPLSLWRKKYAIKKVQAIWKPCEHRNIRKSIQKKNPSLHNPYYLIILRCHEVSKWPKVQLWHGARSEWIKLQSSILNCTKFALSLKFFWFSIRARSDYARARVSSRA